MTLDEYLRSLSPTEKHQFAGAVERSYHYLRHVAKGRRAAGAGLAAAIERETNGVVTRESLRGDYFGNVA